MMKRRELPDGTIEIEGEPDELAEYDNLKTETPKKKKGKKKLLTEELALQNWSVPIGKPSFHTSKIDEWKGWDNYRKRYAGIE